MPDTVYNVFGAMLLAFQPSVSGEQLFLEKCVARRSAALRREPVDYAQKTNGIEGLLWGYFKSPHGVAPRARRLAMSVWNTGGPNANHSSPIW